MNKITLCMLVKNEEFFIDLPLKSTIDLVDEVVIVHDGECKDNTIKIAKEICGDKLNVIVDTTHNGHFGKQRQLALDNAKGEWILWLDADECLDEGIQKSIKEVIAQDKLECFHLLYVHFINNLQHVDNSEPIHVGLFRLHKNKKSIDLSTKKNHALPNYSDFNSPVGYGGGFIWHLGYLRGIEKTWERFKRNVTESIIHNPIYMSAWKNWHILGNYPTTKIPLDAIPEIIKDKFHIGYTVDKSVEAFKNENFSNRK